MQLHTETGTTMLFGLKYFFEPDTQTHHSINLLDEAIQQIHQKIQNLSDLLISNLDIEDLKERLFLLEKEIAISLQHLSDILASHIESLPELEQAKQIGAFRRHFHEVNNSYGKLKAKLLKEPFDEHLSCMCHFSKNKEHTLPLNCNILDMHEGKISNYPPPTEQSLLSILIFTCGGGQGHFSATKAMGQNAFGKYHMLVANTLEETLAANDLLKKFSSDFSHEKLYNYLLKHEKFEWLKLVISCGSIFYSLKQKKIEHLIRLEVLKQKPNMLISCIPIMNSMFLNIAKEFQIPLLIVTTDLDTKDFIKGMNARCCDLNYPYYRFTLAYDDPEMRAIAEKVIPKERIHITGFPVRPSFNEEIPDEKLTKVRQKYEIKENERVILIMMGGNAGLAIEQYAQILSDITDQEFDNLETGGKTLKVICLCGDPNVVADQQMRERINQLIPNCKSVSIKGMPSTPEIAELMTLADLLITKPGGCTTNEALIKKLPMIFHAPFALMDWEVFNMEFCIKNRMGQRFKLQFHGKHLSSYEIPRNKFRLLPLLKNALKKKEEIKHRDDFLEMKDFKVEFLKLTEQLLKDSGQSPE